MQSYAQSPDGGDGIIIASNYAVTLLSHYYKERTHYGRIGCEDYIGGFI